MSEHKTDKQLERELGIELFGVDIEAGDNLRTVCYTVPDNMDASVNLIAWYIFLQLHQECLTEDYPEDIRKKYNEYVSENNLWELINDMNPKLLTILKTMVLKNFNGGYFK